MLARSSPFFFACTIAVAQQTLTVGPGQPFTTIPAAIAAAAPGDTVLVLAGTYTQNLDIDKPIQLVGRGANLQLSILPGTATILVHDIPAGQTFAMSGFAVVSSSSPGPVVNVTVRDCDGPVALRNLQSGATGRFSVSVLRCDQAHLASCFVYRAHCEDSTVVVENCLFEPTFGTALTLKNGNTTLVQCTVPGANNGFLGSSGLHLDNGALSTTRSEIRGSIGGFAAITTAGSGSIVLDPSTTLIPSGGQPAISGPIVPVTADLASHTVATNSDVLSVYSHGPAGELFATFIGLAVPHWTTSFGTAWLDAGTAFALPLAVYDPVTRSHSIAVPHPPLPPGIVFGLQPVHSPPAGPTLGIPSIVTTP